MVIKDKFSPDKVFWISDTHFGHMNIIKFCNRPYYDDWEMNEDIKRKWNNKVPKDGIVFMLGDLAFNFNVPKMKELVNELNGTIYFIPGNHDYHNGFDRQVYKDIFDNRFHDILEVRVENDWFMMCHYPMLFWRRGRYHLHGHVHSGPDSTANELVPEHFMRYDVGVDNNKFTPVSYYELKEIFKLKKDAHEKRKREN
jgi:calcineurin-like phosphoesterase family protein